MESDRLRSTLYSSLDSLDALSSNDDLDAHDLDNNPSNPNDPGAEPEPEPAAFTFDLPLTPMIQQRLKESSHFLDGMAMDWGGTGSGGGRQEVLSVMATGRSGKGALEMTTSFVDVVVDTGGDPPQHHQGTPVSAETQSRASSDGGHSSSDGGHSGGSGGPVANGLAEDAGQDSKDWLQGCLR